MFGLMVRDSRTKGNLHHALELHFIGVSLILWGRGSSPSIVVVSDAYVRVVAIYAIRVSCCEKFLMFNAVRD